VRAVGRTIEPGAPNPLLDDARVLACREVRLRAETAREQVPTSCGTEVGQPIFDSALQWVQGPPGDALPPEAIGAVMEVTKCLKPPDSVSRIGDSASVQAATRVNAEQASHDEGLVKGSHYGDIEISPVASVSKVQAHLRDAARFRARSTSHAVAALSGCTKIPLSAGRAQEDENHSRKRHSGHGLLRFVYLDPPGLIRSWEMAGLRWCIH
jgi:hypothetical protein